MRARRNLVRCLVVCGLLLGIGIGAEAGPTQSPQTVPGKLRLLGKRCSQCGRSISMNSQVGQKCPYCGVRWGRIIRKQAGAPVAAQPAKPAPKATVKPAPKAKPKSKVTKRRRHRRHRHVEDDWLVPW